MAMLSRLQRARLSPADEQQPHSANYELYKAYYHNNELYSATSAALKEESLWGEAMRPLKTPVQRVVEFYAAKLMAGPLRSALPLVAEDKRIIPAIEQVWRWSNWGSKKQLFSRWLALFGDGFIKIARSGDTPENTRVFFQVLDPEWVREFRVDERGYVIYARIDIPTVTEERGRTVKRWYTEEWTPARLRIWESQDKGNDVPIEKLGSPNRNTENALGFIPIVHAPFRDVGEVNGANCFIHCLDKINEQNRAASRLAQMMFRHNKPTHVAKTEAFAGKDAQGRPKPIKMPTNGEIQIGDDTMMVLPPGTELDLLVPDIDWGAYLKSIEAMDIEIQRDLPELKYYTLNDNAESSGIALRYMLSDAIDRVIEVRGNAYHALVRANQIALTIAQRAGLEGFSADDIGTFEDGNFEHEIADTPIIALSPRDQADTVDILVRSGVKRSIAMRRNGFTDEEIAEQEAYEQQAASEAKAQAAALAKQAAQNATPASNTPTGVRDETMPETATPVATSSGNDQ